MSVLESAWLGTVGYAEALDVQADAHARRIAGEIPDTLLQLEHPPVFTIGRRGSRSDVLWDARTQARRGVEVFEADRGGMVTFHGPGQLVGYPIIDLGPHADLVGYLRNLEEALIRVLEVFGVTAGRLAGCSGVWVADRKIAAVGVRVTRGITKHGFALNVSCDMSYFSGIVPCGIVDKGVTSVLELTGEAPALEAVAREAERWMGEVFERDVVRVTRV